MCIAGAQHHIRVGPVLRIEERIAPDRDPRISFGDLAKLHADVTLARIRAHRFREHANADVELRRASFISAPVVFTHSCRMASARGSLSIATPNAFATQSAVMSPWVGPIPPVVKT